MAHFSVSLALLVGVSYLVYHVLNSFIISRRRAARALELGCKEPPFQKVGLPLGISNVRAAIESDRQNRFPEFLVKQARDMGTYTWRHSVLGEPHINTHEPRNIQAILATNFGTFDLGPQRADWFWPMLGNGIFTEYGPAWKHSRNLMRPQFTREQVSDLDLEERHVQNMMSALKVSESDGWTSLVDLQTNFFRLTVDSATEFLLGESANSQLQHIPDYSRKLNSAEELRNINFATSFDRGQTALARRVRLGPFFWAYNPKWFRDAVKDVNQFMDFYVKKALNQKFRGKEADPGAKPKFVFLEALAEVTQDPVELRSQLLHILLAGRDTTASMLSWLFYILARDPARYKKLRDTIIEEFGTYHKPKEITFAKLKDCRYLQYCNNETLRLYPVVPANGRWTYADTTLPTGGGPDGKSPVFVPKGTTVDYSVYVMHRRPDLWGPDADQFVPERWENRKVGFEYLPFNAGPRICLGQQFALTEVSYVTVRMIQRFDSIENMESDPVVRYKVTLTSSSANGVKVRLHAASE